MKCLKCGKTLDQVEGKALRRMNEKGVPGVWSCYPCTGLKTPTLVEAIIGEEHEASKPCHQR